MWQEVINQDSNNSIKRYIREKELPLHCCCITKLIFKKAIAANI